MSGSKRSGTTSPCSRDAAFMICKTSACDWAAATFSSNVLLTRMAESAAVSPDILFHLVCVLRTTVMQKAVLLLAEYGSNGGFFHIQLGFTARKNFKAVIPVRIDHANASFLRGRCGQGNFRRWLLRLPTACHSCAVIVASLSRNYSCRCQIRFYEFADAFRIGSTGNGGIQRRIRFPKKVSTHCSCPSVVCSLSFSSCSINACSLPSYSKCGSSGLGVSTPLCQLPFSWQCFLNVSQQPAQNPRANDPGFPHPGVRHFSNLLMRCIAAHSCVSVAFTSVRARKQFIRTSNGNL